MHILQTKLARLEAQLKITKGNRNRAKLVIAILAVEAAIEQLKPVIVTEAKKLLQLRFKNAEVNVTKTKLNITSDSTELSLNLSFSLDTEYYGYKRQTHIRKLKQAQTAKVHVMFEFVGTILLAS